MKYQRRDKKRIARRATLIRSVSIVGVFLLISITGILGWTGKLFHLFGRGIWKADNAATEAIATASPLVRTKISVFKENQELKNKNAELEVKMIDYELLTKENDDLKALFGRLPEKSSFILAAVLAKPNRSPYDTIIIDGGSNQKIAEGEKVFAQGTIPIGEISKTNSNDSLVMLYSNPGQVTEAIIEGSNASVELIGRGGGNFEMSIPNDLESSSGTLVTLPGGGHEVIAIIDGILSKPTDPVKKIILRSPINIQSLKWVEIKTN